MVLIDEEGDYVHASIKSGYVHTLRPKIKEGMIHIIRNFSVLPNKEEYRVVADNKIMIQFFHNTIIKEVKGEAIEVPNYKIMLNASSNIHNICFNCAGNLCLSTSPSSLVYIDLDIDECNKLKTLWSAHFLGEPINHHPYRIK
ncbi:unnamed protein product [Cuscuta epithymum]|uniref:Replication protein A 70 kDa DNA-binding subunit B/D first OB fold domain-containing protein n=1 Tax=Cuscuta epithymum TaxID=186058 RepID=A0AAV0FFL1_9ASTE|nr:unnamed protein product [Cuscuta epithymum]